MDDFEYSVQISEQDWDSFFQECEECNLLPPVLAGPDDSGMSDMDEMMNKKAEQDGRVPDPESPVVGSPPNYDGSPVELYMSKYGTSPMQLLSGSEEDLHMESVNVFFERLKDISACEDSLKQKPHTNVKSEMSGVLESHVEKEKDNAKKSAMHGVLKQTNSSKTQLRNEHIQKDISYPLKNLTDNEIETHECSHLGTKLLIKEEEWALEVLKEGLKMETNGKCDDLHKEISSQPDTGKTPCSFVSSAKEVKEPTHEKEENDQPKISSNSDSKGYSVSHCQPSAVTPRKKRRKKKRINVESTESDSGHEAQFQNKDNDDDIYRQKEEKDRDMHSYGCCASGTLYEPVNPPCALLTLSIKSSPLENFLVHPQSLQDSPDITAPIVECPNSSKTYPENIFIQKTDVRCENHDITEKISSSGQCPHGEELTSPESIEFVKEIELLNHLSEDSTSPTNRDNEEKHLQLNNQLPLEIMAIPNTSEILPVLTLTSKTEEVSAIKPETRKPQSIDIFQLLERKDLRNAITVPHNTGDVMNSQPNSMIPLLPLGPYSSCSNSTDTANAQIQIEDRISISDTQSNGSGVSSQKETSESANVSCVTFPEITKMSSVFFKNAEEEGNATCMIPHSIPSEHRNGHVSQFEESLDCKPVTASMITQTNTHDTQMKTNRSSGADMMQNTCSLIQTEVENQMSVNTAILNESFNSKPLLHLESEDLGKEIPASVKSKDKINLIENNEADIQSPEKTHANLAFKDQVENSVTQSAELESQLDLKAKSEHSSSNIITSNYEKNEIHNRDRPSSSPCEDHELANASQKTASPSSESENQIKSLETLDLSALSQTPCPVYAMSSFWNEMEKLTINDILRLRLVGQAQRSSVLLQQEDSSLTEISDAADSGYFTLLDDNKPDRSSGDMSFISDFDEELAQLQTPDANKLGEGPRESRNSGDIMWESDLDSPRMGTGMEDMFMMNSRTPLSPSDNVQQCFRKMCKNVSVQNLQALEAQPLKQILRNPSMHSIHPVHSVHSLHSESQEHYVDPFDHVEASSPVHFSDEEDEMESTGITFSEVIQYLFGTDEPEQRSSVVDDITASYLDGTGTSVPETYDQFFSEFDAGNFFFPLTEDTSSCKDDMVPIFSCSRSANRNVQFPEVYDYFFPDDSPVHSDEDDERDQATARVFTRYDHMETKNKGAASDMYEHILPERNDSWSFLKINPFSFRRTQPERTETPEKSTWALTPLNDNSRSIRKRINAMGLDERPFPDPLLLSLENSVFTQLSEQQKICSQMQTTVVDPRVDAPLVPLKQADMCLVCIAFASWVMKTASPQGDAWKAVLLANVSALSAIRYLRKYKRDEATKKTPLRQIEPA